MSYVAFQYAEALFALAVEEKQLDEVKSSFQQFLDLQDDDVKKFLNHPKVSRSDKKEVLSSVVNQTVFRHFLYVLIDNGRMDVIEDCFAEFNTIINNQEKMMNVTVYSPKKLTEQELHDLKQNIGKKQNRTVLLENVIDASILGGIRIEYEGHVLDQTINHYLHSLKNDLTK